MAYSGPNLHLPLSVLLLFTTTWLSKQIVGVLTVLARRHNIYRSIIQVESNRNGMDCSDGRCYWKRELLWGVGCVSGRTRVPGGACFCGYVR